jgi:Concanavalin A-like lectin/glucanases superfamily/Secretion system C-terminal sorting domain
MIGLLTAFSSFSQIPSYVPTNGLVGWWPFNGNANDESGNGHHGTVNGATLTNDRYGNNNSTYLFNRSNNNDIRINNSNQLNELENITISLWVNLKSYNVSNLSGYNHYINKSNQNNNHHFVFANNSTQVYFYFSGSSNFFFTNNLPQLNKWTNLVVTYNYDGSQNSLCKFYFDGILIESLPTLQPLNMTIDDLKIGAFGTDYYNRLDGSIDDIAIFNRALTQQEITSLFEGCNKSISTLASQTQTTGQTAQFTTPTIANTNYQWQTNSANLGWQNIPANSTYAGVTTPSLSISSVSLSNHNQSFRVIASSGNCIDTSNVALLTLADTCINTVQDTIYTTVTDTLYINTILGLSGTTSNTIKIYPNPANDHLIIDQGNYGSMAGYSITIKNNAGQVVYQGAINQAQVTIDLSTWTGNGIYFVHLLDPQQSTVTIRKIVLN